MAREAPQGMTPGTYDPSGPAPAKVIDGVAGSSEFGGDPGVVQPLAKGHVPTPSEELGLMHRDSPEDVAAPVRGTRVQ